MTATMEYRFVASVSVFLSEALAQVAQGICEGVADFKTSTLTGQLICDRIFGALHRCKV